MIANDILLHELQLGNRLASSVNENRRSDFALLLALLSKDVREQSQFFLDKTIQEEVDVDDAYLRGMFELPNPRRLDVEDAANLSEFNQASFIDNFAHIRLAQAMNPLPFVIEDNDKKISDDVVENTCAETQFRVKNRVSNNDTLNQSVGLNVARWMDAIESARQVA